MKVICSDRPTDRYHAKRSRSLARRVATASVWIRHSRRLASSLMRRTRPKVWRAARRVLSPRPAQAGVCRPSVGVLAVLQKIGPVHRRPSRLKRQKRRTASSKHLRGSPGTSPKRIALRALRTADRRAPAQARKRRCGWQSKSSTPPVVECHASSWTATYSSRRCYLMIVKLSETGAER
jgi:hypothetical protein